jgi:WD40 repeat protein
VLLGDLKSGLEAAFFSKDGNHMLIPRRLTIEGNRLIDLFTQASYEDKPVSKVSLNPSLSGKMPVAALSSDGSLLAAADDIGTVKIWQASDLDVPSIKLRGHEGPVYAFGFSPDGKFVATGGSDGVVRRWEVHKPVAITNRDRSWESWSARLDELTELAGKTAGRNLTQKEWSEFFRDEQYRPTFRD